MDETAKKAALENLRRLAARIKELNKEAVEQEEKITLLTGQLAKVQGQRCWWDGESCQKYSEIRGLQDCGIVCSQCQRLDKETLLFVLEQTLLIKEGLEEAWEEIDEKIADIMAGAGVEPAD